MLLNNAEKNNRTEQNRTEQHFLPASRCLYCVLYYTDFNANGLTWFSGVIR